jgi:hypothetical protein
MCEFLTKERRRSSRMWLNVFDKKFKKRKMKRSEDLRPAREVLYRISSNLLPLRAVPRPTADSMRADGEVILHASLLNELI